MSAKLLIINDDMELDIFLRGVLEARMHQVVTINSVVDIDSELQTNPPDLIILNAPFSGLSEIDLCQMLREKINEKDFAILLLSGDKKDTIHCLELGADDHLTKPVSARELIERIYALLRRTRPSCLARVLKIGTIELDREKIRVSRAGRPIKIGPSEYRLLEFLMESAGRVFSRAELIRNLWEGTSGVDIRTVDVYIGRLRASLNHRRERDPIRTVRAAGYAFDEQFVNTSDVGQRKRSSKPVDAEQHSEARR